MPLTNQQILICLEHIIQIETLHLHDVRNDIIHVGDDFVLVRSERTGRDRPISYDRIRNYFTQDESIIDAVRRILAKDGESLKMRGEIKAERSPLRISRKA